MREVEPRVYLVAETRLTDGLFDYLQDIGNPDWETDAPSDGEELVEAAGRMCYRSWQPYDPEKPDCSNPNVTRVREGNEKYIGNILKSGHGSVLEHVNLTFICSNISRVFTHELTRHRAGCAYCLDGDTLIYSEKFVNGKRDGAKKRKIKDLFEMTKSSHGRSRIKLLGLRTYNTQTKQFEKGKVKTILFSGKKKIFKVSLEGGYSISCSKDHLFLTCDGWKTLEEITKLHFKPNGNLIWDSDNKKIAVNGVPVYQNKEWLKENYLNKNLYQKEVAQLANVSPHTIKKWIHIHGLHKSGNKVGFYKSDPWNKNKNYKTKPKTRKERVEISKRMMGANNHSWKGGATREKISLITRKDIFERDDYICQLCHKRGGKLTIHHIIPYWYKQENHDCLTNLVTLCRDCHYQVNGKEFEYVNLFSKELTKTEKETIRLKQQELRNQKNKTLSVKYSQIKNIEYVGEKDTYDIVMDEPPNKQNFVANGVVTHNSQESLRYVRLDDLKVWLPEDITPTDELKDQCSEVVESLEEFQKHLAELFNMDSLGFAEKKKLTSAFRRFAPIGLATTIMFTANIRALRHIIELRTSLHAEVEIRKVFLDIAEICKVRYPNLFQDMTIQGDGVCVFENSKV